jgi:hypothetical protein
VRVRLCMCMLDRRRDVSAGAIIVGGRGQVNKDHHDEQQEQDSTLKSGNALSYIRRRGHDMRCRRHGGSSSRACFDVWGTRSHILIRSSRHLIRS